jgi:hypothetical protein
VTVTDVTDVTAALARIRDYREQVQRADRQSDQNSLDRARDLELIYQSMQWVDDLPAPKHQVWRGRPVDPRSRNRFATWVLQQTGLSPSYTRRFALAVDLVNSCDLVTINSERALRPLLRLRRAGYGEHIPEVYKRAVELAEGQPPTSAETTRAVRDFLAKYTRTDRQKASSAEKLAAYQKRIGESFTLLMGLDQQLAGTTLNSLIDAYNTRIAGDQS